MIDEKDLEFIPFANAEQELDNGFYHCLRDRWWIVHPEKGLVLYRGHSPQCNSIEDITRRLRASFPPWAEVRFVPCALIEIDPSDYA